MDEIGLSHIYDHLECIFSNQQAMLQFSGRVVLAETSGNVCSAC